MDLSPRPGASPRGVCCSGSAWPDRSLTHRSRHWSARSSAWHAPAFDLCDTVRTGMTRKPRRQRITGGVYTHSGTHHAAVVLMNGRRLADAEFPATAAGYADLLAWM